MYILTTQGPGFATALVLGWSEHRNLLQIAEFLRTLFEPDKITPFGVSYSISIVNLGILRQCIIFRVVLPWF